MNGVWAVAAVAVAVVPLFASAGGSDASFVVDGTSWVPVDTIFPVGTTALWTNNAAFAHTTTIADPDDDAIVYNVRLEPGQSTTFTFPKTGVWKVRCTVHSMDFDSGMSGRIAVEPAGLVTEEFGGRLLVGAAGVAVEHPVADWTGLTAESHALAGAHQGDFFLLRTLESVAAPDPTVCFFDAAGNALGCVDVGRSDGALGAVPDGAASAQVVLEAGVDVTYELLV